MASHPKDELPWYSAIKDCIHLFNPEVTYNNTLAVRIPSVPVSTDRRKKEWIITNCLQDGYTIGKIDYKSPSARTLSVIHWSCCAVELDLYSPCPGCLLNTNVVSHSNCSFSIRSSQSKLLPRTFVTIYNSNNLGRTVHIDDPSTLFKQMTTIQDINIRHSVPTVDLAPSIDEQLIHSQIHSPTLANDLLDIWIDNVSFLQHNGLNSKLEAYTDGSLASKHVRRDRSRLDNISMMGSGWFIVQNNRRFDCGSQLWPSSTKAELIAIWSLLLTVPSNSQIIIFTDSQAAIDGIRNSLSTPTVRSYLKSTNGPILDAIRHSTTIKHLNVNYIKVKSHSGDAGNDIADGIAKSAITRAEYNNNRIIDSSRISAHRLTFRPFFRTFSWDGHFRKNLSTLLGLINNAEWSLNSFSRKWFDKDGFNVIPSSIANNINCIDEFNDFFVENNSNFIRWDITWNLCRTLRHQNRFGPEFSRFNSFSIKCLNNTLPTIENLQKRNPVLYDASWSCHFCNSHDETLDHISKCAAIDWSPVTNSVVQATNNLMRKLRINVNLDFNKILTAPSAIQGSILPSPIASLATGYMPSYIFARLRNSGILHHSTIIATNMIKSAILSFRQSIWKDRCSRQAEKEHRLGITKAMKQSYTGRNRPTQVLSSVAITTTAYHAAKEKWKQAIDRGLNLMTQIIRLGSNGLDNGWGHYNKPSHNISKFL